MSLYLERGVNVSLCEWGESCGCIGMCCSCAGVIGTEEWDGGKLSQGIPVSMRGYESIV